jgi:hypothetical protein
MHKNAKPQAGRRKAQREGTLKKKNLKDTERGYTDKKTIGGLFFVY